MGRGEREGFGVSSGKESSKKRRSYRPAVEALEALRLLSHAAQTLPGLAVPHDLHASIAPRRHGRGPDAFRRDLGSGARSRPNWPTCSATSSTAADAQDVEAGLAQLNRYLSRAWYRAGLPVAVHDDAHPGGLRRPCSRTSAGPVRPLLAEIGQSGIRDVLSRETADGPDFFRAIDTVKKRCQRERTFQPLDAVDVASPRRGEDDAQSQLARGASARRSTSRSTPARRR